MRSIKLMTAIAVVGLAYAANGQQIKKYPITVHGNIKGLPEKTRVFLTRNIDKGVDTVAISYSSNRGFELKTIISEEGRSYFLTIDTTTFKLPQTKRNHIGLLPNSKEKSIQVLSDVSTFPDEVKITGNPSLLTYKKLIKETSEIAQYYSRKSSATNDTVEIRRLEAEFDREILELLRKNNNEFSVPLLMREYVVKYPADTLNTFYSHLSKRVRNGYNGLLLLKDISEKKLMEQIMPGSKLPVFNVNDEHGKRKNIHDIISQNKYTLIDFWASWCHPCRAEMPQLKKVYDAYHSKGFNIVGISCDRSVSDWKKALSEENVPWKQTIEGETKVSSSVFGVRSIPAYVLVDQNGKMIAFQCAFSSVRRFGPPLRNADLKKTIESLFEN